MNVRETQHEHSRHQFNNSLQSMIATIEILKFHLARNDVDSAQQTTEKLDSTVREIVATMIRDKEKSAA